MTTSLDYQNFDLENNNEINENNLEIDNENDNENDTDKKVDISNVDILFEKLQLQFLDSQQIIKTLHNNLKILQKEVLKERKRFTKKIK